MRLPIDIIPPAERHALVQAVAGCRSMTRGLFTGLLSLSDWRAYSPSLGDCWLAVLVTNSSGRPQSVFVVSLAGLPGLTLTTPREAERLTAVWTTLRRRSEIAAGPLWSDTLPRVLQALPGQPAVPCRHPAEVAGGRRIARG